MSKWVRPKCDVLILSADLGTGHHQVSNALKTVIQQKRPSWKVEIFNFFNYVDPLFDQLLKFGYIQMIKHFSYGYEWFYQATREVEPDSRWQQLLNRIGRHKLLDLIEQCSPRVIICTYPTPSGVISQLKYEGRIDIPLVTVITDVAVHSQWIHSNVDAYIVAADIVKTSMVQRGISEDRIFVTGIPLRPQFERPVIDSGIWKKYGLNPDLFTLLIMGGGKGLMPGIENICEKLDEMPYPFQIVVVTGTNKALARKLEPLAESCSIPIHVLGYVDNIASLMKISQLLLTKAGGVTVFEALAAEIPMLLYKPLPGHEMCNVDFLLKNRVAFMANTEDEAVTHIETVLKNPSVLEDMIKAIRPISKPFASRNAADIIIAMAESKQKINRREAGNQTGQGHLYA